MLDVPSGFSDVDGVKRKGIPLGKLFTAIDLCMRHGLASLEQILVTAWSQLCQSTDPASRPLEAQKELDNLKVTAEDLKMRYGFSQSATLDHIYQHHFDLLTEGRADFCSGWKVC